MCTTVLMFLDQGTLYMWRVAVVVDDVAALLCLMSLLLLVHF